MLLPQQLPDLLIPQDPKTKEDIATLLNTPAVQSYIVEQTMITMMTFNIDIDSKEPNSADYIRGANRAALELFNKLTNFNNLN